MRLQMIATQWIETRDAFRAVIIAGPPPQGSDFATDSTSVQTGPGTLSQAASMLNYAFDSAEILAHMWHLPLHHVPSDYVLMRAIVDNAIRTIWLLDPNESRARNLRTWLLARDAPARAKARATRMLKELPSRSIAPGLIETARNSGAYLKALDAQFDMAIGPLPAPKLVQAAHFVAAAEKQQFHNGIDGGVERFWSQLSEIVHGSIVPTDYRMVAESPHGHVRTTSANVADLALAAGLVTKIIDGAVELFYTRFGAVT